MIIFIAMFAIIVLMGILFVSSVCALIEEGHEIEEGSFIWYVALMLYSLSESISQQEVNNQ